MSKPSSIAFSIADQDFATTKSIGIWNFSMTLGARLAAESAPGTFTALINGKQLDAVRQWPHTGIALSNGPAGNKLWRLWWDQFGVYRAAARSSADWLFLPKGFPSFLARCPVKLAVHVQDTMGEHYRKKYHGSGSRLEDAYFGRSLRSALRSAQLIFTSSRFIAGQLRQLAQEENIPHGKIVPVGIGFERNPAIAEPKDGSILVFAGRFPHKLTALAVAYLDRWQTASGFEGEVHWVGALPAGVTLPVHANWRRASRLQDVEFKRLMERASVSVYFSEYEGFGMPPVEAGLAGVAPVFSRIPVTEEVMGGLGFPFCNDEYESFGSAMNDAISSPLQRRIECAETLLKIHHWKVVTKRVMDGLNG